VKQSKIGGGSGRGKVVGESGMGFTRIGAVRRRRRPKVNNTSKLHSQTTALVSKTYGYGDSNPSSYNLRPFIKPNPLYNSGLLNSKQHTYETVNNVLRQNDRKATTSGLYAGIYGDGRPTQNIYATVKNYGNVLTKRPLPPPPLPPQTPVKLNVAKNQKGPFSRLNPLRTAIRKNRKNPSASKSLVKGESSFITPSGNTYAIPSTVRNLENYIKKQM